MFGRYRSTQHPWWRRLGSSVVRLMDRRMFYAPPGLVVSSFRVLRRDVVDRMLSYRTPAPYLRGLILSSCASPVNVDVDHRPRASGRSGYDALKLAAFVGRILFGWSPLPVRLIAGVGALVAFGSAFVAVLTGVRGLAAGRPLPFEVAALLVLTLLNGLALCAIGIIGEQVVRLLQQATFPAGHHVRASVGPGVRAQGAGSEVASRG